MTADMTRQEVRFIRWDVPARKQEDLLDTVKDGERGRLDYGHCVFTALGDSAVALWAADGSKMEYVTTTKDGTDDDTVISGHVPKVKGTNALYNREWLVKILSNMTSDYVRLRVDDGTTIMVMLGEVGEKPAAAIIAPRIDTEAKEE